MAQMPVEVMRLQQAVEQFKGRAPRNLPDGVMEKLDEVMTEMSSFDPVTSGGQTPGQKEARALAPGTDGVGEHYSKAAKGPDGPSPGQREARSLSSEIKQAAEQIAANRGG